MWASGYYHYVVKVSDEFHVHDVGSNTPRKRCTGRAYNQTNVGALLNLHIAGMN